MLIAVDVFFRKAKLRESYQLQKFLSDGHELVSYKNKKAKIILSHYVC